MYSLWEPFQQKVALEPNRILSPSPAMRKRLEQWKKLLSSNAGVAAIRMVSVLPTSPATLTLTIYSDAMRDPGLAGLGGFFHGMYWWITPPSVYARIPIDVLEFIAALTSIMTFAQSLPPLHDVAHTLHHCAGGCTVYSLHPYGRCSFVPCHNSDSLIHVGSPTVPEGLPLPTGLTRTWGQK